MRALLIGGTGTISTAISKKLLEDGHELWLVNRGSCNDKLPAGYHEILADINSDEGTGIVREAIKDMYFDCVADFIAFVPEQLERDHELFKGKTDQFIFISSASAYQKPSLNYLITESTPLVNPYLEYSRNKIACEDYLMKCFREEGFPVTIVRPSHTYNEAHLPVLLHGQNGSYATIKRMLEGKPVIVPGDGSSLWTVTWSYDFAKGFTGLMGNDHAIGQAVQIMSDETLTWDQIHRIEARVLGVEYKPFYVSTAFLAAAGGGAIGDGLIGDKAVSVVFDCSKLKSLVPGFTATTRFDQGAKIAAEYILSHPECQIEDPEFDAFCDRVIAVQEAALENFRS